MKKFQLGAIFDKAGNLRYVDADSAEESAWRHYLGWPAWHRLSLRRRRGFRFATLIATEGKPFDVPGG